MCGLAGIYDPSGIQTDSIRKMTDALVHRGPDAAGIFTQGCFGIGHRRLSILDLSEAADQPMRSACGRYQMVYNGEVYNHVDIAHELGGRMETTSDTEVVLKAFVTWGPKMVSRLNGMFAIAILDTLEDRLFLFRDRLGIKPLYVYRAGKKLAFASELKAITAVPGQLPLSINRSAIPHFLHLGYIPEPLSIYQEVRKFPAGTWAETDGTDFQTTRYWQAENQIGQNLLSDETEAKLRLSGLLQRSVERRLMSDVPFGTFLSGGIDSSLVTALAQKATSEKLKTFSIGFKDTKHNEAPFAQAVSNHLGTDHREFMLSEKDAIALVPEMFSQYDEPFADSSAIPTMLVSKMARQEVTMTLSGDGGDELFLGYGSHRWAQRLNNPMVRHFGRFASPVLALGSDRYKRVAKLLKPPRSGSLYSHIFSQEQYLFSKEELNTLLIHPFEISIPAGSSVVLNRKLTGAELQAFYDLKYYLKDDLLTKVDRASMKYALETRVPLLDHEVVEFSLNLNPNLKFKQGQSKYLLKQVLYDHVPRALFNRPKWGFSVPLDRWLRTDMAFLISDHLNEKAVRQLNLIHWESVRHLTHLFQNGQSHLYNRLWLLIVLHRWFQQNRQNY